MVRVAIIGANNTSHIIVGLYELYNESQSNFLEVIATVGIETTTSNSSLAVKSIDSFRIGNSQTIVPTTARGNIRSLQSSTFCGTGIPLVTNIPESLTRADIVIVTCCDTWTSLLSFNPPNLDNDTDTIKEILKGRILVDATHADLTLTGVTYLEEHTDVSVNTRMENQKNDKSGNTTNDNFSFPIKTGHGASSFRWVKAFHDLESNDDTNHHTVLKYSSMNSIFSMCKRTKICSFDKDSINMVQMFAEVSLGLTLEVVPSKLYHEFVASIVNAKEATVMKKRSLVAAIKIMLATFIFTELYVIFRYNVFGRMEWSTLPTYLTNKALAWTAISGLALLVLLIGRSKTETKGRTSKKKESMGSNYHKKSNFSSTHKEYHSRSNCNVYSNPFFIQSIGDISMVLLLMHSMLSLVILSPSYNNTLFSLKRSTKAISDRPEKFNLYGESSMLTAVLSFATFLTLTLSYDRLVRDLPNDQNKNLHSLKAIIRKFAPLPWIGLAFGTIHVALIATASIVRNTETIWMILSSVPITSIVIPTFVISSTYLEFLFIAFFKNKPCNRLRFTCEMKNRNLLQYLKMSSTPVLEVRNISNDKERIDDSTKIKEDVFDCQINDVEMGPSTDGIQLNENKMNASRCHLDLTCDNHESCTVQPRLCDQSESNLIMIDKGNNVTTFGDAVVDSKNSSVQFHNNLIMKRNNQSKAVNSKRLEYDECSQIVNKNFSFDKSSLVENVNFHENYQKKEILKLQTRHYVTQNRSRDHSGGKYSDRADNNSDGAIGGRGDGGGESDLSTGIETASMINKYVLPPIASCRNKHCAPIKSLQVEKLTHIISPPMPSLIRVRSLPNNSKKPEENNRSAPFTKPKISLSSEDHPSVVVVTTSNNSSRRQRSAPNVLHEPEINDKIIPNKSNVKYT